ncbi:hypothetical protein BST61_g6360 [Cercospora zeina]
MPGDRNVDSWPFWNRFSRETLVGPENWKYRYILDPYDQGHLFMIPESATRCLQEAMARRNALGASPVKKIKELRRLVLVLENEVLETVPYHHEESDEGSDKPYQDGSDEEPNENSDEMSDSSSEDGSHDESEAGSYHHKYYTGTTRHFHANLVIWPKIEHLALSSSMGSYFGDYDLRNLRWCYD